jgi:hypothetical protein
MEAFLKEFLTWPLVVRQRTSDNDDEHVDRLNHRFTVGLIFFAVFLTSTTPFIKSRISCWLPAELKRGTYVQYVEDYCWISNTYYIPSNVTPPHSEEDRRQAEISN